jgi:hypothetical protein
VSSSAKPSIVLSSPCLEGVLTAYLQIKGMAPLHQTGFDTTTVGHAGCGQQHGAADRYCAAPRVSFQHPGGYVATQPWFKHNVTLMWLVASVTWLGTVLISPAWQAGTPAALSASVALAAAAALVGLLASILQLLTHCDAGCKSSSSGKCHPAASSRSASWVTHL